VNPFAGTVFGNLRPDIEQRHQGVPDLALLLGDRSGRHALEISGARDFLGCRCRDDPPSRLNPRQGDLHAHQKLLRVRTAEELRHRARLGRGGFKGQQRDDDRRDDADYEHGLLPRAVVRATVS
jgi:hypothetical protein